MSESPETLANSGVSDRRTTTRTRSPVMQNMRVKRVGSTELSAHPDRAALCHTRCSIWRRAKATSPRSRTGLVAISRLATESADFSRFLRSPVITADDKAGAIDAILAKAGSVHAAGRQFRQASWPATAGCSRCRRSSRRSASSPPRRAAKSPPTSPRPSRSAATQLKTLADTLKAKIGKTVTLNRTCRSQPDRRPCGQGRQPDDRQLPQDKTRLR